MQIIPVIDLKNGHVVHAVQGNREHYAPIHSPLCQNSDIFTAIEQFLNLYPFDIFYIADIDAITGQYHHEKLIWNVLNRYPDKTFWIDSGLPNSNTHYRHCKNHIPVIGSESLNCDNIDKISEMTTQYILSLDFTGNTKIGDLNIFETPQIWPNTILIMNLSHVGSDHGPDYSKLTEYSQRFPEKEFVAAGGIRSSEDLAALNSMGISKALIASALHSGNIKRQDIIAIMK
jgi:phosphoribosylformimino-5-aminoimidazole carboxamide ribotide isomerase